MKRLAASLLVLIILLEGCSTISEKHSIGSSATTHYERRCGQPLPLDPLDSTGQPLPAERVALVRHQFSASAFDTASALGVLPFLDRLLSLEEEVGLHGEGPAFAYVRERRHITDRITLGILDVSSAAVEADCEQRRAALLAEHLQKTLDERERTYTVLGLLGSGILTIISGGIGIGANSIGVFNTANIATVIGGASELIFGTAALTDTTARSDFHHERNLLRDIWTGENSTFAPAIWSFFNRRLLEEPVQRTFRENLIAQWEEEGRLGPAGSDVYQHRIDLFFGAGGRYTVDELRDRAAMLDLVANEISLMNQGLNGLIRELLKRDKV